MDSSDTLSATASPWKCSSERAREREIKREAVLRMAARIFNEKGFHATSLEEVADRLHVTRPTLYYYFKNKDQILFECVRLGLETIRDAIAETDCARGSGLEKLVASMRAYGRVVTQEFGMCLIRVGEDPLGDASRRHLRALKAEIDREFRRLIEGGMDEGSLARGDVRITAFTVAGALSWIARWYGPDTDMKADDIIDRTIEALLGGLSARPPVVISRQSGHLIESHDP